MRAVLERVESAEVQVDGHVVGAIGRGLLALVGVTRDDGPGDAQYIAAKIRDVRVFPDDQGKMNRSLKDIGGEALVVSQFTLCGDARKGRRPSFDQAAPPELGRALYEDVVCQLRGQGLRIQTGTFQAHMMVRLVNDGPVTILLDSQRQF